MGDELSFGSSTHRQHGSGRDQLLERTLGVRLVGMAQLCPTTAPCYPLANIDWGSGGFEGTRPSLRQGRLPPLSLQSWPHGFGIEGVPSVVEEFFTENKLPVKSDIPTIKGTKFSTPDGRLTVFVCDLFDATPELIGNVDAVWDRGSFVALSFDARSRYVALLRSLVGNSFRYLLQAWEYDTALYPGPPHSVTLSDMETFFGPWTEIKVLEEIMMGPEAEQVQRFKVDKMTERIFFMLPTP